MNNITNTINKLYDKNKGFYMKYGTDLIIAIIIIYIFLVWTTYYYVLNHIPLIKSNWAVNKCNPLYLPFAGIIINDNEHSNIDLIGNNFDGCIQNILGSIVGDVFKPIYYVTNLLNSSLNEISQGVHAVRSMFDTVRKDLKDVAENISGRTLNITTPIVKTIITTKNMVGQTQGVITSAIYTLFGSYLILKSFLGSIIQFIEIILAAIAIAIAAALWIPFIGEFIALPLIAIEIAATIPFIIMQIAIFNINNQVSGSQTSGSPACFGTDTIINLSDNTTKKIADINIGNILADGSTVTGIMKLSSFGQITYNLNNIIVTSSHRVYHETKGWIKVSDHPNSYLINYYKDNIVYCLNTDNKVIKINGLTFTDWDDLDDIELIEINNNCDFLPKNINNKDIHKYLDNGLTKNTLLELEIGTQVEIQNIEVNDILKFGIRVLGVIKIDAKDILTIQEYNINNMIIKCSHNIQIYIEDIGNINTYNLYGNPINEDFLYQLITDTGYFYINTLKISDYNIGIEKYLSNV